MGHHRSRKLLDLAHRVTECQVMLPGICQGYSDHGCEPAHSNRIIHGSGMGCKSHDLFHAAACHACHFELDNGNLLDRDTKQEYWQAGFEKTMLLYFQNGWVGVTKK